MIRNLGKMSANSFTSSVPLPVSAAEAFAWHERPGALERLIPPWEDIRVVEKSGGIRDGGRVVLRQQAGPFPLILEARHYGYVEGKEFNDRMVRGPFSRWEHRHAFEDDPERGGCLLTDSIRFDALAGILVNGFVRRQLERMFAYRHAVTRADLQLAKKWSERTRLRVLVTGASGLVGRTLCPVLTTMGHEVLRLVRRGPVTSGQVDLEGLESAERIDAVVHLAGENVAGGRWTSARRRRILQSREEGTRNLVARLARLPAPPRVFVGASAIGYYGNRGEVICREGDAPGDGFLSDVCQAWERETMKAAEFGARVVCLRTGIVLSPAGGALGKLLPLFRAGLGGPIGNGKMWMSWISIDDLAGGIVHALMDEGMSGPVNAVAPQPVSNADFSRELARVLKRPALLAVPSLALRLVFGEMADQTLLSSLRVCPGVLEARGYEFRHPEIAAALRHLLGQSAGGEAR
jgi:uncharacterized protein (TIGR01777 family)